MSGIRVLSAPKNFVREAGEELIDLFNDPYFPSIQQFIKKEYPSLSNFSIIDGFKKASEATTNSLIYRIFLKDANFGLRDVYVTVS